MTYQRVRARQVEVYGITGKKGSGKDTFASFVQEYNPNFRVIRFADDLKSMASQIFGFSVEDANDQTKKEARFQEPINMDSYLPMMCQVTGLKLEPRNLSAHSIREVLQFFGSDYVRRICDSYWIDRVVRKISHAPAAGRKILVTDCRFVNEAKALQNLGAAIIRIARIDLQASSDSHVSETEMDLIEATITLGTKTGKFDLQRRVAYLIALGKAPLIAKFDYDTCKAALGMYAEGHSLQKCSEFLGLDGKEGKVMRHLLEYYDVKPRHSPANTVKHVLVDGVECKFCSRCKNPLPLEKFSSSSRSSDMLASHCKECLKSSEKYKNYSQTNTLEKIFKNSKKTAAMRRLEFSITFEEVQQLLLKQRGLCFYSGRQMTLSTNDPCKLTLDRVDSSLGYTAGNVVLCAYAANLMKRALSVEDFSSWVSAIHVHMTNTKESLMSAQEEFEALVKDFNKKLRDTESKTGFMANFKWIYDPSSGAKELRVFDMAEVTQPTKEQAEEAKAKVPGIMQMAESLVSKPVEVKPNAGPIATGD